MHLRCIQCAEILNCVQFCFILWVNSKVYQLPCRFPHWTTKQNKRKENWIQLIEHTNLTSICSSNACAADSVCVLCYPKRNSKQFTMFHAPDFNPSISNYVTVNCCCVHVLKCASKIRTIFGLKFIKLLSWNHTLFEKMSLLWDDVFSTTVKWL